jgi:hypothetical protein
MPASFIKCKSYATASPAPLLFFQQVMGFVPAITVGLKVDRYVLNAAKHLASAFGCASV